MSTIPRCSFATAIVCYQLTTSKTKPKLGHSKKPSCSSLDGFLVDCKSLTIMGWVMSQPQPLSKKSIFLYDSTLKLYKIYFGALENMIIELFRLCGLGRLDKAL